MFARGRRVVVCNGGGDTSGACANIMSVRDIPVLGSELVVEWFGSWPAFHDAEILALLLRRDAESRLEVRS